jgi:GTP-binding protein
VARGGRGGRGNSHFISVHNKAPRIADHGVPGEECELALELRLIADIGIVGVPNAGKSTFLAAISAARPKIAPYPFTTLVPNLGVADLGGFRTLVLADVPGLIEGAHAGVGLGFEFLRHIQRTRVLIHLLDGMAENPLADYSQIMSELALFDDALTDKPQIVALNKVDLPDVAARMPELRRKFARIKVELMGVSAVTGAGARELLFAADKLLASVPEPAESEVLPVYRPQPDPAAFAITREGERLWCLSGPRIERAAQMTFWEHHDSVRRFQRILTALGVQDSLTAAGAKNGDMVRIGDYQLEWNS